MGSGQSPEPVEQNQRKKYRSVPGHLRTYLCFGCLTEGGDLSPALCLTQVLVPQEIPQSTKLSLPLASFDHLRSMILVDIYSYGRIRPELLGRDTTPCCPLSPTSCLLALSILSSHSLTTLLELTSPPLPGRFCGLEKRDERHGGGGCDGIGCMIQVSGTPRDPCPAPGL